MNYNCLTEIQKEILKKIVDYSPIEKEKLSHLIGIHGIELEKYLRTLIEYNFITTDWKQKQIILNVTENFIQHNPVFFSEEKKMFQLRNRIELLQSISGDDYDQDYLITKKEKEVLTFIIKNPGLSHKELALSLKMKPSALTNKIKILKEHFLVQSIKLGRNVYYYINCKFLENNPTFLSSYQTERKESLIDNEKQIFSYLKNILIFSSSVHSKLLLDHLDFFQLFFSIYELIHLINLLDIYRLDIDPSFSNLNLLKLKDENFQNINKKELLIKYKIVCLYLSNEYNDQKVRTMK